MVVTLTGEDSFGIATVVQKLVADFVSTNGDMAVDRYSGTESSFERMQESLQSPPFLSARKLVVLRAPSANKRFCERCEALLQQLPDVTDVVLVEPKLDKRSSYYKLLKSKTDFQEFQPPDESGVVKWLVQTAMAGGGTISASDGRYLIERTGTDRQLLAGELTKLLLYDPHITRQTIGLLTEAASQSTIFELLEAAFGGQTKRALRLYKEQREQKVDPANIIAMLTWQLWIISLIKAAGGREGEEVSRAAKINPYVVRKSVSIAKGITLPQLKRIVSELALIDARSKREPISLDDALQGFLLTLTV